MSAVRHRGTSLEIVVRTALDALAIPYTATLKELPGTPDLANQSEKWSIFVNGCFWHGHKKCAHGRLPKTNRAFWREKILSNRKRDHRNELRLKDMGYRVLTIWECELRPPLMLGEMLAHFFSISSKGN
jgi:DNA mismatch endonuclease (patch repair protein)